MSLSQDWTPVVLKKKGSTDRTSHDKKGSIQVDPAAKRAQQLDAFNAGPPPKIEKVSPEDKREIIQLRILKKITQEELNKRLNLKKDTIKTIENGTHEKNKALTNKIKEFLSKIQ
jgi:DNA-binding XRE family transcriptional regulator